MRVPATADRRRRPPRVAAPNSRSSRRLIHARLRNRSRLIWWALLGILLIGFAIMDGFDLGIGMLLPFVARTDDERRVLINTVGPGLGRQPGLADPRRRRDLRRLAAALRRRLFRLLPRDVPGALRADPAAGRLQIPLQDRQPALAQTLGWALFVGGFVPALVFGVAFGNLLLGAPFRFDDTLRHDLRGHALRAAQSVRAPLRPGQRRDAGRCTAAPGSP